MKIYFVRHGQSESNKKGILTGHIDIPLSSEGIEQAKKTSLEISSDFEEIYSSDLIRCKQTAEIINKKLNTSIKYDSRLRERNFGSLAGKSWEEVGQELKEIDKNQKYDYQPYGGEHVDDVKKRIFSCIEEIKTKHPNKKILIVTSGGIIRLLHNMINGQVHGYIENSSIHEFEFPDNFLS
ncbi:MAG: histidine phosphatase family protein [Candidatus Paceibacterota bacterium]|jgi:alpha-ribazole phosphatase/probable phosphoglycerate mutase